MVKKIDLINLFMHHSGEDITFDDVKKMMSELGDNGTNSEREEYSSEVALNSIKRLANRVVYVDKSKEFISFYDLCQLQDFNLAPDELPEDKRGILKQFNRIDYSELSIKDASSSVLNIIRVILLLSIAGKNADQIVYSILISGSNGDEMLDETIDYCLLNNKKSPVGIVNSSISEYLQNRNIKNLSTEYDDFKKLLIEVRTCIDSMFAVNRDKLLISLVDPTLAPKDTVIKADGTVLDDVVSQSKKPGDFSNNLSKKILAQNLCRSDNRLNSPTFKDAMIYLEFKAPKFGGLELLDSEDFDIIDDADLVVNKSQIGKCSGALKVIKFLFDSEMTLSDILYSMIISSNKKINEQTKLSSLSNSLVYKEIYWSRCAIDCYLVYANCTNRFLDSNYMMFIKNLLKLNKIIDKALNSDLLVKDLLSNRLQITTEEIAECESIIVGIGIDNNSINRDKEFVDSEYLLEKLSKDCDSLHRDYSLEMNLNSRYSKVIDESGLSVPVKSVVKALSFLMTTGKTAKNVVVSALTGEANSHKDLDEALVSSAEDVVNRVKTSILDPANQYLDKCKNSKTVRTSSKLVNFLKGIGDSLHEHNDDADEILKSDVDSYYDNDITDSEGFKTINKFNKEDDLKSLRMDLITFNSGLSFFNVYAFLETGISPDRRFYLFNSIEELDILNAIKDKLPDVVSNSSINSYSLLKSVYYLICVGLDEYDILISLVSSNLYKGELITYLVELKDVNKYFWLDYAHSTLDLVCTLYSNAKTNESKQIVNNLKSLSDLIKKVESSNKTLTNLLEKSI